MLHERQIQVLEAVVNRIIPPDDDPGGWEGGAGDYLLRQFEGDLKPLLEIYQHGLQGINAEAMAAHSRDFAPLSAGEQDALLANIERGQVRTAWQTDPAAFFALLVEHCAEGYYADPGNGGNKNGASWHMIGFEVTG